MLEQTAVSRAIDRARSDQQVGFFDRLQMGFDFRRQFAALQAGAQLTADLRNFNNVNTDCRK